MFMETTKKYDTVPIFIVEDHNDVVPFIHRAIGGRYLPMFDIVFVHFDSHPDLLIPAELKADDVFKKDVLYENSSIENWILPMVYAGHISDVIWFKPPWCHQIEDKTIHFYVGKCCSTGFIRTTCKESYFVSETLYRSADQLLNKKTLTLTVVSVEPCDWSKYCMSANQIKNERTGSQTETCQSSEVKISSDVESDIVTSQEKTYNANGSCNNQPGEFQASDSTNNEDEIPKKKQKLCTQREQNKDSSSQCIAEHESQSSILSSNFTKQLDKLFEKFKDRHMVLDIDLDFFSTKNPFRGIYTPEQFQLLQKLYVYKKPEDDTDEAIMKCVEDREKQLADLKNIFLTMMENPQLKPEHERRELILTLVQSLRLSAGEDNVDFGLLHEAGCTCDDTELPHHVSSEEQITLLVDAVQEMLSHMHKPTLITMARSSNDDYCPPDQVDMIQDKTLEILQDLYLKLNLTASY